MKINRFFMIMFYLIFVLCTGIVYAQDEFDETAAQTDALITLTAPAEESLPIEKIPTEEILTEETIPTEEIPIEGGITEEIIPTEEVIPNEEAALIDEEPTEAVELTEEPLPTETTETDAEDDALSLPMEAQQCGDSAYWINDNGVLRFTGSGELWEGNSGHYAQYQNQYPWHSESFTTVTFSGSQITVIPGAAFMDHTELTNVYLPETLEYIYNKAFYNTGLKGYVTFPATLKTIARQAFAYAGSEDGFEFSTIGSSSQLINIIESAFQGSNVTLVNLGKCTSLTAIPKQAFKDCEKLTQIALPSSLTSIGNSAFENATALETINVQDTQVKTVGDRAFYNCKKLNTLYYCVGDKIETIGNSSFEKSGIQKAILSAYKYLKSIGERAFADCPNLSQLSGASISIPSTWESFGVGAFSGSCIKDLDLSGATGLTSIPAQAFENCVDLYSVILPPNLVEIGDFAFNGCVKLLNTDNSKAISFPNSLQKIGNSAFKSCIFHTADLSSTGVTSIGTSAFENSGVETVKFPTTLTEIQSAAFKDADALRKVYLEGLTTAIKPGTDAFAGVPTLTEQSLNACVFYATTGYEHLLKFAMDNDFDYSPKIAGEDLYWKIEYSKIIFYGTGNELWELDEYPFEISQYPWANRKFYTIQFDANTITNIPSGAFKEHPTETGHALAVTFPTSLISIGDEAFYGCPSLSDLSNLGKCPSLKTIGESAFQNCSLLTKVSFPSSLETLGKQCFKDSSINSYVRLNETAVTEIPDEAFSGCSNILNVFLPAGLKSIGKEAFYGAFSGTVSPTLNFSSLTALTAIGEGAFKNCVKLAGVTLPSSLTTFKTLGNQAFMGDTSLTAIALAGTGLTAISDEAFSGCSKLESVTYPTTLTSIGQQAFYNTALTTVSFPASLKTLGSGAFSGSKLTAADLSGTAVTSLPENIFSDVTTLAEVKLPTTLTAIGAGAFSGDSALADVWAENNKNKITVGNEAFKSVPSFNDSGKTACLFHGVTGKEPLLDWAYENKFDITPKIAGDSILCVIENGVLKFTGSGAMWELKEYGDGKATEFPWTNLSYTSVTFADTITSIPAGAFKLKDDKVNAMTSVTLPTSLKTIGAEAFYKTQITALDLSKTTALTSIGDSAFKNCAELATVTLPSSLTTLKTLGKQAFMGDVKLGSIALDGTGITSIPDEAFSGCVELTSVTYPTTLTSIGKQAFYQDTKLTSGISTTLNKLTTIDESAFYQTALTTVDFPATLKTLGSSVFSETKLTAVDLTGTAVTSLPENIFSDVTTLTEVKLPTALTAIGAGAFSGDTALADVWLENNNKTITVGNDAFKDVPSYNDSGKTPCLFHGSSGKEPVLDWAYDNQFDYTPKLAGEKVFWEIENNVLQFTGSGAMWELSQYGEGKKDKFRWNEKTYTSVTFEDAITTIPQGAFKLENDAVNAITSVTLPASLTSIGVEAFYKTQITALDLSKATVLTSISDSAFKNCAELATVTLPSSLTTLKTLGKQAFMGDVKLGSIALDGTGLTAISDEAFSGCSKLASVTYPTTLTGIGQQAFYNTALTTVSFPASLKTLGSSAFSGSKLSAADLTGTAVTSLPENIFSDVTTLAEVKLPTTLTAIGAGAFSGDSALAHVWVENNNNTITVGNDAFKDVSDLNDGINKACLFHGSTGMEPMLSWAFDNNFNYTPKNAGDNVTWDVVNNVLTFAGSGPMWEMSGYPKAVSKYPWSNWDFTSVTFADNITAIPAKCLDGREKVDSIKFPSKLTSLGDYACQGTGITEADLESCSGLTAIGEGVFKSDVKLTAVKFPSGIKTIGKEAFYGTKLSTLDLSSLDITSIGDSAFAWDGTNGQGTPTLVSVSLPNPSSLATLGKAAFANQASLTAIDLSKTKLTAIPESAFEACTSLASADYPSGLTSVGANAFKATALTSVNLSTFTSLTSIGAGAYDGCTKLTELVFPASLKTIGANAFRNHALTEIDFTTAAVTSIPSCAFAQGDSSACGLEGGTATLQTVTINAKITAIADDAFNGAQIIDNVNTPCTFIGSTGDEYALNYAAAHHFDYTPKKVGDKVFWSFDKESGVLSFTGQGAMWELSNYPGSTFDSFPWAVYGTMITGVEFDDAITTIPANAFNQFTKLAEVDAFPKQLTSIGDNAFNNTLLTELDLSATKVTSIGAGAFATNASASDKLASVNSPSTLTTIGKGAFKDQALLTEVKLQSTAVSVIPESAFEGCVALASVEYPANLTSIGASAFKNTAVKTADLKNFAKLTSINASAYEGCGLTTLTLPSSLTVIGEGAFKNHALEEISLRGLKVKDIPAETFAQTTATLKKVEIDKTLVTINDTAFSGVTELPSADACVFLGVTGDEPALTRAFELNFEYTPKKAGASVYWSVQNNELKLSGSGDMWELSGYPGGADKFPWDGMTYTTVTIDDTITGIAAGAFAAEEGQAQTVNSVHLPTALKSIGANAFANNAISTAELANCPQLTTIGDGAFSKCSDLATVTFPATLQIIGNKAFAETKITKAELGNSKVTSIGDQAFYNCTDLTEFTIPATLQKIGASAFEKTAITTLNLDTTKVTEIGKSAFQDCSQLATVTFPTTLSTLGASAFSGTAITEINLRDAALTSLPEKVFADTKLTDVYIKGKLKSGTIHNTAFSGVADTCTFHGVTGDEPELIWAKDHHFTYEPKKAGTGIYWEYDETGKKLTFTGSGDLWETNYWQGDFPWANLPYEEIVFDDAITNVPAGAFTCSDTHNSLKSVDLPNGLTSIGASAFTKCENLTALELPDAVKTIGDNAFRECGKIGNVTFPSKLQSIGNYAFNATNLTNAVLSGTKVTYIGEHAFDACSAMTEVDFPATLRTIGASAFTGTQLTKAELAGTGVLSIGNSAFEGLSTFDTVTFPATLQTIGDSAFKGTALTNVEIRNTKLISIGASAFEGLSGLETVDFPATLNTIGESVFKDTGLKKLVLNNTAVKQIPEHAFENTPMTSDMENGGGCWLNDETTYIAESAFNGVSTDLWFYGKGGSYQINWALAHNFQSEPSNGSTVGINFNGIDPKLLAGLTLGIIENGEVISETELNASGSIKLSMPKRYNGIIKAQIFNKYNQLVAQAIRSMDDEQGLEMYLEDFVAFSDLGVIVMLPDGTDVTNLASISWADENHNSFPIGDSLSSVPVNTPMTCTVKLNLADDPYIVVPESVTKLTKHDAAENVFVFTAYHAVTAEGNLYDQLDPNKPVAGAKVRFIQTLTPSNGQTYQIISEAVSDANGHFVMKDTYGKAGTLEVTTKDYVFYTAVVTDEDAVKGNLGDHELVTDQGVLDIRQENIRALVNGNVTLNYTNESIGELKYRVYDENKKLYEDMTGKPVSDVSIDEVNQTVTVTNDGTGGVAYVEIYGTSVQGIEHSDLCRVEFNEAISVQRAYTTEKAVKVYPYTYDVTRIPVVIELGGKADVTNDGSLITEAGFVDTNVPFDLRVADDNTLEILVREDDITSGKVYESSYQSEVYVKLNMNGEEVKKTLTKDNGKQLIMTIKVNTKLPKVKVTAPVFNSAIDGDYNLFTITGGTVKEIKFDNTFPAWLETKTDEQNIVNGLISHAAKNLKTKLNLPMEVTLEGWRVPFTTGVKLSFAPTIPTITAKMASGSLRIGTKDVIEGKIIFPDDKYKEIGGDIQYLRITEGKSTWTADDTSCPIILSPVQSEKIIVKNNLDSFKPDGKNHNYTVYYKLANCDNEYSFRVKTNGTSPISLSAVSANTIDLSIPGSYAIVTVDVTGYAASNSDIPSLKFYRNCKDSQCTVANEVSNMFDVKASTDGSKQYIVRLSNTFTDSMFNEGDTFIVRPYQCFTDSCDEMNGKSDLVTIKGSTMKVVKSDPLKVAPKITGLQIQGKLEISNPESKIIITPVFKNWPNYQADPSNLVVYADGIPLKGSEMPFIVSGEGDHFVIRRYSIMNIDPSRKYSVLFNTILNGQLLSYPKKGTTSIAVVNTSARLELNVKSLTLYKVDPSYADTFTVNVQKPAGGKIVKAEVIGKTAKYFEILQRSDEVFTVGFKDAKFPSAELDQAKSATVQINFWLDGNGSQTADKKINLTVDLK